MVHEMRIPVWGGLYYISDNTGRVKLGLTYHSGVQIVVALQVSNHDVI